MGRIKIKIAQLLGLLVMTAVFAAGGALPASASYTPFNTNLPINVGIGTSTPQAALAVMSGNVGIGTWVPASKLSISGTGVGNGFNINNTATIYDDGASTIGFDFAGVERWTLTAVSFGTATGSGPMLIGSTTVSIVPRYVDNTTGLGWDGTGILGLHAGSNVTDAMTINNGNVGIGTTLPAANLQIGPTVSTSTATPSILDMGGTFADTVTSSKAKWKLYSDGTPINTYGIGISLGQMNFFKFAGGSYNWYFSDIEKMRLTSDGNLGIGSTAPGQALDVQGVVRATSFVGDGSGLTGVPTAGWSTGTAAVYTSGSNNVGIGTSTPQGALVVTNGNVGIGTWAPSSKFEIDSVGGAGTGMNLRLLNDSSYTPIDFNTPSGLGGQFVLTGSSFSSGAFGGNELALASELTSGVLHLASIGSSGTIVFTTGGNATANHRMIIASSGNIGIGTSTPQGSLVVTNGNVGIGTWVPAYALDMQGSLNVVSGGFYAGMGPVYAGGSPGIATSGYVEAGTGYTIGSAWLANTSSFKFANGYPMAWTPTTSFDTPDVQITRTAVGILSLTNPVNNTNGDLLAGNIGIGTNSSSLYIQTAAPSGGMIVQGNVGIGSFRPIQALDVQGTVRATHFVGDGSGITGVSAGGWSTGTGTVYTTTGSNNVGIGTTTPQGALTIMNGNVGIGTWAPAAALTVMNGNVGIGSPNPGDLVDIAANSAGHVFTKIINSNTSGTAAFGMYDGSIGGFFRAYGTGFGVASLAGNVSFGPDGANGIVIFSNANSPSGSTGVISLRGGGYDTPAEDLLLDKNGSYFTHGNVGIGTTTPQGAFVVTNGNVGIGTWAPSTALDIVGLTNSTTGPMITLDTGLGVGNDINHPAIINAPFNYFLELQTSGNSQLTLQNNGCVTFSNLMAICESAQTISTTNGGELYMPYSSGTQAIELTAIAGTYTDTVRILPNSTSQVALNVQGMASQSGDLQQWQNSSGTVMADVNSAGNIGIGTFNPFGGNLIVNGGGNVGIGSLTPGQALDVQGTVRATHFVGDGSGITGVSAGGWSTGTGVVYITTGSNNVGIGTTTPQGGFVVTNGNVGIGTWVPAGALDINGALIDSTSITLTSQLADKVSYAFGTVADPINSAQTALTLSASAGSHDFYLGPFYGIQATVSTYLGATALAVVNNGDIWVLGAPGGDTMTIGPTSGIPFWTGSYNPGAGSFGNEFQIAGNGGGLSATTLRAKAITSQTGPLQDWQDANGNTLDLVTVTGNVGIGSLAPGKSLDVQGTVRATHFVGDGAGITGISAGGWSTGTGTVYTTTGSNNVGIGTTTPQGGLVVTNGNVGIGTWIPTANLSFGGNASNIIQMERSTGTGNDLNIKAGGAQPGSSNTNAGDLNLYSGVATGSGKGDVNVYASGTNPGGATSDATPFLRAAFYGNKRAGVVDFEIWDQDGSEPFRVMGSNGNRYVDLDGVTTLQVIGSTAYFGSNASSGSYLGANGHPVGVGIAPNSAQETLFSTSNSDPTQIVTTIRGIASQTGDLTEWQNSSSAVLDVVSSSGNIGIGTTKATAAALTVMSGNVGIGTWVPAFPLDITNNGYTSGLGVGASAGSSLRLNSSGNSSIIAQGLDGGRGYLDFIPESANPSLGLRVIPFNVFGTNDLFFFALPGPSGYGVYESYAGAGVALSTGNSTPILFTPNRVEKMRLTPGGNVGIGTTAPQGALVVMSGNVGIGTWVPRASVEVNNSLAYSTIVDNGNSGTSKTVNWATGNNQSITLSGNCTFTFTAPGSIERLMFMLTQDGTGSHTATWPAAVKWPGGIAPTLTTTASAVDMMTCLYNGTNYYCSIDQDLR